MSSLLDQINSHKILHGKLNLLGSRTHPLVSEKVATDIPPLVPTGPVHKNPRWLGNIGKLAGILAALGIGSATIGGGITGGIGRSKLRQMEEERPEALPGNIPISMPPGRLPAIATEEETKEGASPPGMVSPNDFINYWIKGQGSTHPMSHPLAIPAAAITAIGATIGASHLANKYFHNKMKELRTQRLGEAQSDFDKAMLEGYNHENLGNEKISAALNKLYDELEKRAAKKRKRPAHGPRKNPAVTPPPPDWMRDAVEMARQQGHKSLEPPDIDMSALGRPKTPPGIGPEMKGDVTSVMRDELRPEMISEFRKTPEGKDFTSVKPPTALTPNGAGVLFGGLGALSLGSGILGTRAGYNWAEQRKPENLLLEAMKQRALTHAQAAPEPIQFEAPTAAK